MYAHTTKNVFYVALIIIEQNLYQIVARAAKIVEQMI